MVTAEQADSALGHPQSIQFGDYMTELLDSYRRSEEASTIRKHSEPAGIYYACLNWTPHIDAADDAPASPYGLGPRGAMGTAGAPNAKPLMSRDDAADDAVPRACTASP